MTGLKQHTMSALECDTRFYLGSAFGLNLYRNVNNNYDLIFDFQEDLEPDYIALEHWAKAAEYTRITGPMAGSTWYNYRLNVGDESMFMGDLPVREKHLNGMEKAGYEKAYMYFSAFKSSVDVSFVRQKDTEFISKKYALKDLDGSPEQIRLIYDMSMSEFINNPYFCSLPFEMFQNLMVPKVNQLTKTYSKLLMASNGDLIAFALAYPDESTKSLIIKTVAQNSNYKGQKWGSYLAEKVSYLARKDGYKRQVHAMIYDGNINSKSSSKRINGIIRQYYALFQKIL